MQSECKALRRQFSNEKDKDNFQYIWGKHGITDQ